MADAKTDRLPPQNEGCAGCLFLPASVVRLAGKEIWALRAQRRFYRAITSGDKKRANELMIQAISHALQSGLSKVELAWLERAMEQDRSEAHTRLAAAFEAGSRRDPSLPASLSNGMDEVMREAQALAREQRLRETPPSP